MYLQYFTGFIKISQVQKAVNPKRRAYNMLLGKKYVMYKKTMALKVYIITDFITVNFTNAQVLSHIDN
jgi:hypothetical protein